MSLLTLLLLKWQTMTSWRVNNGKSGCLALFELFLCGNQLYCDIKCTHDCPGRGWRLPIAKNDIFGFVAAKMANNDALAC